MLLSNCGSEKACQAAGDIQSHFQSDYRRLAAVAANDVYVSLSIGVIASQHWKQDPRQIVTQADIAMYEAKKSGKSNVCQYHDEMWSG